jgi:16S rRNA (cytosine1402-N4)-methyltransferase
MLREAVDALAVKPDGFYVDATFGRGGHSQEILQRLSRDGRLLAIDRDPQALLAGQAMAARDARLTMAHAEFSQLQRLVASSGIGTAVDGVLLDLGVSSPQIDTPERGFSFLQDGPLDMRMNPHGDAPSAADWLASAEEAEIARVLWEFGEERFSRRIAKAIVASRNEQPMQRTGQLAALIAQAIPFKEKHKHPATRSFQAIRIHLNRELEEISAVLEQALSVLSIGGRLVVISFHSLEDRIVKRFFKTAARGDEFPKGVPVRAETVRPRMRLVKTAKKAGPAEIAGNARARSAVLRAAEKLR